MHLGAPPRLHRAGLAWQVSLKCSIYKKGTQTEPRLSELVVKIEVVKTPRKLTGSVDLAAHASYERTSSKLVVPLSHGAGYLKLTLSSAWAEMGGDGNTLTLPNPALPYAEP